MRGSPRARIAVAILVAWGAVLSLHAWRTLRVPAAERLASAAATLPPGDSWYAVFRGGERAGWTRRQLDTLSGGRGFILRERSVVQLAGLGQAGRTETDLVAWLDAGVRLDSLQFRSLAGADSSILAARAEGDSVLVLQPGGRIRVADRPQLAGSWPLRFAADERARQSGRLLRVVLFDPGTASVRDLALQVGESAMRVWADSADTDPESGAWIAVREDTVEAWNIERLEGTVALPLWVDEDGRVVESREPGGLRLQRAAFELAFFGPEPPR